jgi:hypothetical protein
MPATLSKSAARNETSSTPAAPPRGAYCAPTTRRAWCSIVGPSPATTMTKTTLTCLPCALTRATSPTRRATSSASRIRCPPGGSRGSTPSTRPRPFMQVRRRAAAILTPSRPPPLSLAPARRRDSSWWAWEECRPRSAAAALALKQRPRQRTALERALGGVYISRGLSRAVRVKHLRTSLPQSLAP